MGLPFFVYMLRCGWLLLPRPHRQPRGLAQQHAAGTANSYDRHAPAGDPGGGSTSSAPGEAKAAEARLKGWRRGPRRGAHRRADRPAPAARDAGAPLRRRVARRHEERTPGSGNPPFVTPPLRDARLRRAPQGRLLRARGVPSAICSATASAGEHASGLAVIDGQRERAGRRGSQGSPARSAPATASAEEGGRASAGASRSAAPGARRRAGVFERGGGVGRRPS